MYIGTSDFVRDECSVWLFYVYHQGHFLCGLLECNHLTSLYKLYASVSHSLRTIMIFFKSASLRS